MSLNIEEVKAKAMEQLEPMINPAKEFMEFVKKALLNGVDMVSTDQLSNWLFSIPVMYGELRCMEVECLLTAELLESQIDKVKADVMSANSGLKVTDARTLAAQQTHDLQVKHFVANFMAKYIKALWNQFEMMIFSVRNVFESRMQKVRNDV